MADAEDDTHTQLIETFCAEIRDEINSEKDVEDRDIGVSQLVGQFASDLEDVCDQKSRSMITRLKHDANRLKQTISDYEKELDKRQVKRDLANKTIRDMATTRTYLNRLFDKLWQDHVVTRTMTDNQWLELARGITILKRPSRVLNSDSLKLAVCVLNGLSVVVGGKFRQFAIMINDFHHAKVKPSKVIVTESLSNLETAIKMESLLPETYKNLGLDLEVINLIKFQVNLHMI